MYISTSNTTLRQIKGQGKNCYRDSTVLHTLLLLTYVLPFFISSSEVLVDKHLYALLLLHRINIILLITHQTV